jgi:hypothetical protein
MRKIMKLKTLFTLFLSLLAFKTFSMDFDSSSSDDEDFFSRSRSPVYEDSDYQRLQRKIGDHTLGEGGRKVWKEMRSVMHESQEIQMGLAGHLGNNAQVAHAMGKSLEYGETLTRRGLRLAGVNPRLAQDIAEATFDLGKLAIGRGALRHVPKGAPRKVTPSAQKVKSSSSSIPSSSSSAPKSRAAESSKQPQRVGKQGRLKELAKDDKLSSADRGWLRQEEVRIQRGQATTRRVPPGKQLSHLRGREAAKGYDHSQSVLQNTKEHMRQHKHDKYGRLNKERK